MSHSVNRRQFLGQSIAASALASAWHLGGSPARATDSPNEKLNLAAVGVAHKAAHNIAQLKSENFVALCDVDENFLNVAAKEFPKAKLFRDYRQMLDSVSDQIDGVVVSTPDHMHAPATSAALALKKHVYCEKPLTHTVAEARAIAKLAKETGVATQMGTQVHAGTNYRRVVELIQSGAIGPVREVYNWCNKGWSNGRYQQCDQPAPAHLDWNLWLGPAPDHAYCSGIHPSNWRRFWEYGSGTFGDMACHVMDLPFWALNLRHPTFVHAEGPEVHPVGAPAWCKATYEFPTENGPLKFYWSDGGAHFDKVKNTKDHSGKPLSSWGLGILFIGEDGMLVADYGRRQLLPQNQFEGFEPPPESIPNSIGHWNEWVKACKTGSPTTCNFDYSGALTETVLLGPAAYRTGKPIEWDAAKLEAINNTDAEQYISKEYRDGFEVIGV